MGYTVMDGDPKDIAMGGVDFSYNHDNVEHKAEFDFDKKDGENASAAFYRIGFNFLEENRLKLEGQYAYTRRESMSDYALGAGATYKITSDLAARVMYEWQHVMDDHRIVTQLYYYFRM
jgi:opacity protein-like surface antigen